MLCVPWLLCVRGQLATGAAIARSDMDGWGQPTNHLDMESIDSLAEAINAFEGGLVLVSHDFRLIGKVRPACLVWWRACLWHQGGGRAV